MSAGQPGVCIRLDLSACVIDTEPSCIRDRAMEVLVTRFRESTILSQRYYPLIAGRRANPLPTCLLYT